MNNVILIFSVNSHRVPISVIIFNELFRLDMNREDHEMTVELFEKLGSVEAQILLRSYYDDIAKKTSAYVKYISLYCILYYAFNCIQIMFIKRDSNYIMF